MAGAAGACLIWVAGVAGVVDVGCMCSAGGGNAGCATKNGVLSEPVVWQLWNSGQCWLL